MIGKVKQLWGKFYDLIFVIKKHKIAVHPFPSWSHRRGQRTVPLSSSERNRTNSVSWNEKVTGDLRKWHSGCDRAEQRKHIFRPAWSASPFFGNLSCCIVIRHSDCEQSVQSMQLGAQDKDKNSVKVKDTGLSAVHCGTMLTYCTNILHHICTYS